MVEDSPSWRPEVRAEFRALPDVADPTYLDQLMDARPEVQIIARRATEDGALREKVDELVVGEALPVIERFVRRWAKLPGGASHEDWEDVLGEAVVIFWRDLKRKSYFEDNYNWAMQRLARKAAEQIRGAGQGEWDRAVLSTTGMEIPDEDRRLGEVEAEMMTEAGLRAIPRHLARVLRYRYLIGLPVFKEDPDEQTVASALHYSAGHAWALLRQANLEFTKWLQGEGRDD